MSAPPLQPQLPRSVPITLVLVAALHVVAIGALLIGFDGTPDERIADPLWPMAVLLLSGSIAGLVLGIAHAVFELDGTTSTGGNATLVAAFVALPIATVFFGIFAFGVSGALLEESPMYVGDDVALARSILSAVLMGLGSGLYLVLGIAVAGFAYRLHRHDLIGRATANAGYVFSGLTIAAVLAVVLFRVTISTDPFELAGILLFLWAGLVGIRLHHGR